MTPDDLRFDNSYARALEGFYQEWQPATAPRPTLVYLNRSLAAELGWDVELLESAEGVAMLSGNRVPAGARPLAQAYAGHQFGGFSPQLGDGRALLLGEVIDTQGRRRDIAFKGSGRTPFSRGGDGKAALGPMLREVLIGEAMHALGIPTTRALAVVATGEPVFRERALPGAVLTRVAASHLRVGTFQYFAARQQHEQVSRLAGYSIARHDPALVDTPGHVLAFLEAVSERQASLLARWMNVGFIHGVMNTDNMTVSGETIDYGPCAFLETYDPATVFSSIDHQGRYAFGRQPAIAQWNLARLAETLLPLIDEDTDRAVERATAVIDQFPRLYQAHWLETVRAKLGLTRRGPDDDRLDEQLARDWLDLQHSSSVDFTLAWRRLADVALGNDVSLRSLFVDRQAPTAWLEQWKARCEHEDKASGTDHATAGAVRAAAMRRASPFLIPRNHRVEEALAAASEQGDLVPFERLLQALQRPFDEDLRFADLAEPAPAALTSRYQTFCGT
jgi:serine/tyrosine/threonine adenylyltransferase